MTGQGATPAPSGARNPVQEYVKEQKNVENYFGSLDRYIRWAFTDAERHWLTPHTEGGAHPPATLGLEAALHDTARLGEFATQVGKGIEDYVTRLIGEQSDTIKRTAMMVGGLGLTAQDITNLILNGNIDYNTFYGKIAQSEGHKKVRNALVNAPTNVLKAEDAAGVIAYTGLTEPMDPAKLTPEDMARLINYKLKIDRDHHAAHEGIHDIIHHAAPGEGHGHGGH